MSDQEAEYTPTLEAIAKVYAAAPIVTEKNRLGGRDIAHNKAAFHRALTAHDADLMRVRDERIAAALAYMDGNFADMKETAFEVIRDELLGDVSDVHE